MGTYDREETVERAAKLTKIGSLAQAIASLLIILKDLLPGGTTETELGVLLLIAGAAQGILALGRIGIESRFPQILSFGLFEIMGVVLIASSKAGPATLCLIATAVILVNGMPGLVMAIVRFRSELTIMQLIEAALAFLSALYVSQHLSRYPIWHLGSVVGFSFLTNGIVLYLGARPRS